LRREGLLPHCGVEMDFPGCYKFDKEEWDWYYMPNGEDCAEESKCFENS
jgi:hypothetical protein